MGDKIFSLIEHFATGKNRRIFWFFVIIFAFILLLTFPYIIATFFSLNRIEARIDNLSSLLAISNIPLESQPILNAEYQSILRDIEVSRSFSFVGAKGDSYLQFEKTIKYIGGCCLFYIVSPLALFDKTLNEGKNLKGYLSGNFSVFITCIFLGTFLGFLSMTIPTIGFAPVNATLVFTIQFSLILYWAYK